ncbi:hypothetical protein BY458DRAFT_534397 [Sporodiniella umbellata]|nr:hypothetical protein BY458DRAFT_534397 [Sporodiniella umbellata]
MDVPLTPPLPALRPVNTNSLYHNCLSVLDRLSLVEGMTPFLQNLEETTDPLSKLTSICQLGFPLLKIYNALNPTEPLTIAPTANLNATNVSKAAVYHFIVACRDKLAFKEMDMFSIGDVFSNGTNGIVRVVHTLHQLLQRLEERGTITVRSLNRNSDPNGPRDTRDNVFMELLETERKYVNAMETLQDYMWELQHQKILSPDTLHYLFGNLNSLLDFQRRFLIGLENMAEKSPREQRVGQLFLQTEQAFSVYEPYCANYYSAQDLVVQETPKLMRLASLLDPTYELPSLLIKPVQRICKYPLLLQELVRSTDPEWPFYQETLLAVDAIRRVAEKVNETQRQHENNQTVRELQQHMESLSLEGCGNLVLCEKLQASLDHRTEREYHLFLFERSLLLCKEAKNRTRRNRGRGSLTPKTMIEAIAIESVLTKPGSLQIDLSLSTREAKHLSIRYRNEEQLSLWSNAFDRIRTCALDEHTSEILPRGPYTDLSDAEEEEEEEEEEDEEDMRSSRSGSFSSHPLRPVPALNLLPLLRSHATQTEAGFYHPTYYPASPPPSLPPSPSRSHHGQCYPSEDAPQLPEDALHHPLLHTGRSHSQPAADVRPLPGRLRSQSNPNLLRANQMIEASFRKAWIEPKSTKLGDILSSTPLEPTTVKIRFEFNGMFYVIVPPARISFHELMEKIKAKLKTVLEPGDLLRLKYWDEENDLITINSDDDVVMAFEAASHIVNLAVSI